VTCQTKIRHGRHVKRVHMRTTSWFSEVALLDNVTLGLIITLSPKDRANQRRPAMTRVGQRTWIPASPRSMKATLYPRSSSIYAGSCYSEASWQAARAVWQACGSIPDAGTGYLINSCYTHKRAIPSICYVHYHCLQLKPENLTDR
jgi:hypothetical protein